jgi:crotonobetainyl-CoA:carnitine CoA-transferase CaiB-like acyl-CoA transferase
MGASGEAATVPLQQVSPAAVVREVGGPQPLEGLLVLDLTEGVAGPNCTKQLADYGARVVKVERPGGDPARRLGPFPGDEPHPERSGLFLLLNTNKESVVVDLARPEGAALVRALAERADVVVESHRPGALAALGLGLGPDDLLAAKPQLVVTSVTPFGQSGPYRDWEMTEIVAYAMGGSMSSSGVPEREPVKLAGHAVLMQSGATAATATLGALVHAQLTGRGQHVDVATFETQNGSFDRRRYYLLSYQYSGSVRPRVATAGSGQAGVGGRFECADGKLVTTGIIWPDHVARMVKVLGDDRLTELSQQCGLELAARHGDLINTLLAKWAAARPARAAMREAQAAGWPVVVVNDPLLLLEDEHLVARGFWATAAHPVAGTLPHAGPPFRIDGGGWALRRPAPTLGQDTDAVLSDLVGLAAGRIAELRADGAVA